jgi:cation diffusion facilitator family transporter
MADGAYFSTVRRVLIIIFIINILVALIKGAYGLLTGSLSMTTDGLHSFFDGTSNIVGLVGLSLASRPPDRDHPYGHSKFETFASLGIAVLLFATCLQVIGASVSRFLHPNIPLITDASFVIMIGTMGINVAVSLYEFRLGRRLGSIILVADARHTRSDVYASLGVILSLLAVKMGYPLADPAVALVIVALIIHTGWEIIKESSLVLLDRAILEEGAVRRAAESVPGVCSCHGIRTRGSPGEMYIDLHIGVDPTLTVDQAHELSMNVEERIKSSVDGVADVVVHMEPRDFCELERGKRNES